MLRVLFASLLLFGCRPAAPPAEPPPAPATATLTLAGALPAAAGRFTGGPLTEGEGFVRREYASGAARVNVTVAKSGPAGDFAGWVRMSASYPQMALSLPAGEANGFYDCAGAGAAERCDAHLQLRSGYHVELFASHTATRADLDSLVAALPFSGLR